MANPAPGADAVDLLMRDHRLVEQLFLQLDAAMAAGDDADQRELADRIVTELSKHAAVEEEEVLYPAARRVDDTAGLVDRSVAEHEELEALLAGLDGTDPDDPEFAEGFGRARDLVTTHVAEEESELLPALRRSLSYEDLVTLRDRLVDARAGAPDRPRRATRVTVVAEAAGSLIAKAKDAIRGLTD